MNLANGAHSVTDSEPSIWLHTILMSRYPHRKRTMTAASISISCKNLFLNPHFPDVRLTWFSRINTHGSALFAQNQSLREQYDLSLTDTENSVADAFL